MNSHQPFLKLANYLVDHTQWPGKNLLVSSMLSSYAYHNLPSEDLRRKELKGYAFAYATRHDLGKKELLPLLHAWIKGGIVPLIFKGFAIAETCYDVPSQRFYGDVDILFRPGQREQACKIAAELGWIVEHNPTFIFHEFASFISPTKTLKIDAHHLILHTLGPSIHTAKRITNQIWEKAIPLVIDNAKVLTLCPEDSILVGIVLNRAWGGDGWQLKPHDYLDMKRIIQKANLNLETLNFRSLELKCQKTFELILTRCNPFTGILDLRPLSKSQKAPLYSYIAKERMNINYEKRIAKIARIPAISVSVTKAVPSVLKTLQVMKSNKSITQMLQELEPNHFIEKSVSWKDRRKIVSGIKWLLRILRVRPKGRCLPQSLAIFYALRQRGVPVIFCAGIRREDQEIKSHAWIELHNQVLPELAETFNRMRFRVNVEYPEMNHQTRVQASSGE